ncbi:Hypothetical protein PHPALM_4392 [Phytophthora palmivora]|uniref:Uncharacterized protein n=1 Tax=Phytophthora palmivora TaxID=4796 RepID=A0A2P4YJZ3_9STRA|nr:Hypothetical protein PHPALM_4392 [Phytophthora palmivora]
MSATPPPPDMEIASATFFHRACSHEQLFHAEYKRSNRTKGLKILRCFPHCCPEHIDRSYCGTSLSVRVELERGSPSTSQPRNPPPSEVIALFARFEAVNDTSLQPGECVEVTRIAADTQSDRNLEGRWIAGTLDRPSRLVTTIRKPGTSLDDHKPLVFHLNGKPFSRWYYDWESGANKAQRLTKHVLKAYIVERCAIDEEGIFTAFTGRHVHKQLYRVLHIVISPEFTVISYRRAPSEQYQTTLMSGGSVDTQTLAAIAHGEASSQKLQSTSDFEGTYSQNLCMIDSKSDHFYLLKPDPHNEMHQDKRQRMAEYVVPYDSTEFSATLEDKLRWEYTNSSAVSVSRDIALLYAFLLWTPICAYASFVDEIVHLIHKNLKESLTEESSELSKQNCFSRFVLDQAGDNHETNGISANFFGDTKRLNSSVALPQYLEHLLRALAHASQWFYSAETRKWVNTFFRQYAGSVLDKHTMKACFVQFVQELQDRLNSQVFENTKLRTVANAAEEVIAAVYSYPYFYARRPQVRQILSGQDFAGWNAFVAQMRETYIGLSTSRGVPRALNSSYTSLNFDRAHPPRNYLESDWNAEWLLEIDDAEWKFSNQKTKVGEGLNKSPNEDVKCVICLLNVFELISQLVRIEVAIDVQTSSMHIRSTQGVANQLDCMRVVLDGKERIFSQLPNGMASAVDPGTHGNYIGAMRVEQSERLVAYLQIFTWSTPKNGPSFNVRTRIECWRSRRLCVSGDVLVTTTSDAFTPEQVISLGEMSLRDKREAVVNAHTNQHQLDTASTASAWKELGRFRLSYTKV